MSVSALFFVDPGGDFQETLPLVEAGEVQTSPTANGIPRGDVHGKLDSGWVPDSVRTVNVKEADGTSFSNILTLQFPDGSLTNLGAGVIAVASGSNDATSIQGRAVATVAPTDGQAYLWNATDQEWQPQIVSGGGGDAISLQGHPVSTTDPQMGEALVWNGSEYAPAAAGGEGSVPDYVTVAANILLAERYW